MFDLHWVGPVNTKRVSISSVLLMMDRGIIADMFNAADRGSAMGLFAMAPFLGPAIGPIVSPTPWSTRSTKLNSQAGGFLSEASSWKWVAALLAFFALILTIAGTLFLPET
jgi:hypothetical protein